MGALVQIQDAGFEISLYGESLKVIPAERLTQHWRDFLKANKAEIVAELKGVAAKSDFDLIREWLLSIEETDPEAIEEVLDGCARDPEKLAYFLGRAKGKSPKPEPEPVITVDKRTVTCYTPAGNPIEVVPDNEIHAKFLQEANPEPVQCQNCRHFKSFNQQGRGAGTCQKNVMPVGITFWHDTEHNCNQFTFK